MSLFAIADLHLSLGSDKPMDVFEGWGGYIEKIEKNWRGLVGDDDTVVIPGDVSWALKLEELLPDARFLQNLPGRKLIVKGNHDYWWSTVKKMNEFFKGNGFDTIGVIHNNAVTVGNVCVCGTRGWFFDQSDSADAKILAREVGRLEASLAAAEQTGLEPVAFLHFPPVYGDYECPEIIAALQKYGVRRCYYGHLHGRASQRAFTGEYKGIVFRLVSCDSIGFSPVIVENGG